MTTTPARSRLQRWILLAVISTGLLLITLDNTILYTALPTLTTALQADASQSLWIINAYPVVMAGLLLGAGTLGDRVGHRRMFVIGLVVFGAASALAAFAPGVGVLIAARAVLAAGAAAMMPATLALVRITFDDVRERTLAIAVWGSVSVLGAALGPIAGGLLLEHFWWGSVFLVNVPVVLAAVVATLVVAPADRPDPRARWDLASSVLAMAGLMATVVAIKEFAAAAPSPVVVVVAVVVAAGAFTGFVRRQRAMPTPLLDFGIFRNAAFSGGVVAAALTMFAIGGVQLITTQRFQLLEGFSPLQAGLLVSALALGCVPTAIGGSAVVHRTGLLPLIAGGLAVGAVGVAVAAVGVGNGLGLHVVGLVLTGVGMGAVFAVASSAIVGNVPAARAGMASSVEEVSYEFGSLTAVAVLGSLVTALYTRTVVLPAGAPAEAAASMPDALAVGDEAVVAAAATAYDGAYLAAMVLTAAVLAAGAAVTGWMLRHHGPGGRPATLDH